MKVAARSDRTHKPFDEIYWVSRLRENLTSGSDGEGLETELRSTLHGHDGGNPGYSQGHSYGSPRQSLTRQLLFLVLKEGCRVEALQLSTMERVERALALFLVVAWRVARLMRLGRTLPDLDAQLLFEPDEWQAAYILAEKAVPKTAPTLNEVLRTVAGLGERATVSPVRRPSGSDCTRLGFRCRDSVRE